ncbi:MAG: hypothetical protein GEU79_10905 [Acidimicrobiia bacterium]|nr:hypothetical protein [Acidimicrobiia bacterium]
MIGGMPQILIILALVLVACTAGSDNARVLAAEDVIEGDITVVPDSSGTRASLLVTTSVEMACAVVYGTTPELGDGIATDSDMAGGAHTNHEPILSGLQPDTEYFYRIQGSGADGQLYRSELMTFRTPTADPLNRPGENIAPDGEVSGVSSEFSDAFVGAQAIDGDPITAWSTAGDGDDAWIEIDLGAPTDVVGLGFQTREMGDGTAIVNSYTITVDGGDPLGPFAVGPGLSVVDVSFTGQILRFEAVETTGGNTGAVEIEIYR